MRVVLGAQHVHHMHVHVHVHAALCVGHVVRSISTGTGYRALTPGHWVQDDKIMLQIRC